MASEQEKRGRLQQEWINGSADYAVRASDALDTAAGLAEEMSGEIPETELARLWALIGQGWATLAAAEAGRSTASATTGLDQDGISTFVND
jgi:hypothetical protein